MSVYANGREVSGKAQPNKVVAGFPSVCLSPPPPPAGPIPIPYPMFTEASKTSGGTGSVFIKGKEVGKKNGSTYASSKGNEPATRSFGMDVVSHTLSGASRHQAYSFDVVFEKSGAERFMDLTTTNHSNPATAAQIDGAGANRGGGAGKPDCKKMQDQNRTDFTNAQAAARRKKRKTKRMASARSKDQAGITIAQAAVPGGGMRAGTSSATVRELLPHRFNQAPNKPLSRAQRRKVRNKKQLGPYRMDVCPPSGEIDYQHPSGMEHAEIHILNSVSGLGGRGRPALTLAIEWRESYKGKLKEVRQDACKVCQTALKHACACFAIYICNAKNKPEPFCDKDKDKPRKAAPI